MDWAVFALLLLAALSASLAVLALAGRTGRASLPALPWAGQDDSLDAVFLFDDRVMIDASGGGHALLRALGGGDDWEAVTAYLLRQFDGVPEALATLPEAGQITLAGRATPALQALLERRSGLTRISLCDTRAEGRATRVDRLSLAALDDELTTLRAITDLLPGPVWRQGADGAVTWANRAYVLAAEQAQAAPLSWPLPPLFPTAGLPGVGGAPRRLQLVQPAPAAQPASGGAPAAPARWFDCRAFAAEGGVLFTAQSAEAAVKAESALKEFVQTLTKTFAHLPIGLAIFDRQRQLALFNPALIDLTALGPDFLSARPTLLAFLDGLRENRMMPEPKDYRSWRQQMTALEVAATSGEYRETWTLASGQTYQVTGRPHPDGAMALLFEDISAEVSVARRYRSRIEIGQALLDGLPEAMAVYSHAGTMEMCNAAFAQLWPELAAADGAPGLLGATALWQRNCEGAALWDALRDYAADRGDRQPWQAEVTTLTGQPLRCRLAPVPGGGTLIAFLPVGAGSAPAGLGPDLAPDLAVAQARRRLVRRRARRAGAEREAAEPGAGPENRPGMLAATAGAASGGALPATALA